MTVIAGRRSINFSLLQNGLTALGMAICKQHCHSAQTILRLSPLAPPCCILTILRSHSDEATLALDPPPKAKRDWSCHGQDAHHKKGRRACIVA